jgi:hypothetical protein
MNKNKEVFKNGDCNIDYGFGTKDSQGLFFNIVKCFNSVP